MGTTSWNRSGRLCTAALTLVVSACGAEVSGGSEEGATKATGEIHGPLVSSDDGGSCATAAAGGAWLNRPTLESSGVFTASWLSHPTAQGSPEGRPIDAVLGFSQGPADWFSDLGPIIRFNPGGYIDARNAEIYSGRAFPYTFGQGPYEFQLRIDVAARHYTAWVRHLDSPFKPFELLATDFAFRTEQSSASQLDHFAAFVDSSHGAVENCGLALDPPSGCVDSESGVWRSRAFTSVAPDRVHLDFFAWVTGFDMDVVMGVASGAPTRFDQLAAIVRFRPDGRIDARNGSAYAADVDFRYGPFTHYRITLDVDLARKTYSVYVTPWGELATTLLARDYAFRSEQAGVVNLDHLGQFVDGTPGKINTCALVAH